VVEPRQLQVATIVTAAKSDDAQAHPTQGTRVMLSDGSELTGVVGITLRADVNSMWTAIIEVMPQVVPSITANAEVKVIDITALKDSSRQYATVSAD
jgi:hypothetical protein